MVFTLSLQGCVLPIAFSEPLASLYCHQCCEIVGLQNRVQGNLVL